MKKILAVLFILVILCSPIVENQAMASADEVPRLFRTSNSPIDQFSHLE